MKKIILGLLIAFSPINLIGKATPEAIGNLALTVYIDKEKTDIPQSAYRILQNKMNQMISKKGIGGMDNQRFIMTANVYELTKDITATAPPMHAITIEVTFYIGDGIDGILFASKSITGKGVGETEDKAYINALKAVKPLDPELSEFVEEGKVKIIEYYDFNIERIIAEANSIKNMEKYDEAINLLMSVPKASDGYLKAMEAAESIYKEKVEIEAEKNKEKMEQESAMLLNKAKNIWSSGLNFQSAKEATAILSNINPHSSSFTEAERLRAEIENEIKTSNQREWETMQKDKEMEYQLEMSYLNACKEIAIAEAENTPDVVYEFYWW